jgi:hypothetical protein
VSQPVSTEALLQRFLEGTAPPPLRQAAARGALPLPRGVLARLFVLLLEDEDETIRTDAQASLDGLGKEATREVLSDPSCAPEVLRYFARKVHRDETLADAVVFHAAAPGDALEWLAAKGSSPVIDLVLTNEERLLSSPVVLERLMMNPALRADQRGRLLELLDRASKAEPADAEDGQEEDASSSEQEFEEAARLLDVDVGELFAASEIMGGEEFETSDVPEVRSAYRKIVTLNAAQRAILAMKGGREERMILIRDTNKVVALSVLKNPRLPEGDVELISSMRNVTEDVLRGVGTNRDWTKNYSVVLNLVRNPRTPPGVSTNFISRLQNRDLKFLARDKNVPEIIRRMSKRTLDMRTQRAGSGRKKR